LFTESIYDNNFNFADDSELGMACMEREESPVHDWKDGCKK